MEQQKSKDSPASSVSEPASNEAALDHDRSPTPTEHSHLSSPHTFASHRVPTSSADSREPSLRFPRPQANSDLVNWISNSDPDIMRLTTTSVDDNGLSGSTYELIHEERERDLDSESQSQDDNYAESNMTESIGSLGYGRADDVQSLAGTEKTGDTESVADDETHVHDVVVVAQNDISDEDHGADTPQEPSQDEEDTDVEESHASLEFTQQSLGTPSCRTPNSEEAPGPESQKGFQRHLLNGLDILINQVGQGVDALASADLRMVWVSSVLVLLSASLASLYLTFQGPSSPDVTMLGASLSTTAAVTTSATTAPPVSSLSTSTPQAGMALIPVDKSFSTEWFSRSKPGDFSLAPRGVNQVFIALPTDVKARWETNSCLSVSASRGEDPVTVSSSYVSDGAVFRFPRRESHGVVRLTVQSSCRPAISKTVKVHFGKGVVEEVLDYTKSIALGVGQYLPVVAQEAEKRFDLAKRSLGALSRHFDWSLLEDATNQAVSSLNVYQAHALQVWNSAKAQAAQAASFAQKTRRSKCMNKGLRALRSKIQAAQDTILDRTGPLRTDLSTRMSATLVESQVSAKLWWLKATGRREEHDSYDKKAKGLLAKLHEERKTLLARSRASCKGRPNGAGRSTKDCKRAS